MRLGCVFLRSSIVLVVATQAKGSVLIHQKNLKAGYSLQLIDMGAQIILCDPHRAIEAYLDKTSVKRYRNDFARY
jgi:UDP-N-acetylglucosamine 1-carboxyvinyltransferase